MRTENAPTARDRLRETEQKAVIDIRQANAQPFAAAAVHKKLEGGDAVRLRIVRHAGKLLLRRDHQMQAEVDAAAGGGDRANLVNQGRLKRLSGDDVGEKCGHPASRGRSRLGFGIAGGARSADVGAMSEMDVRINDTRHDQQDPSGQP